jgi:hypothetical protein
MSEERSLIFVTACPVNRNFIFVSILWGIWIGLSHSHAALQNIDVMLAGI